MAVVQLEDELLRSVTGHELLEREEKRVRKVGYDLNQSMPRLKIATISITTLAMDHNDKKTRSTTTFGWRTTASPPSRSRRWVVGVPDRHEAYVNYLVWRHQDVCVPQRKQDRIQSHLSDVRLGNNNMAPCPSTPSMPSALRSSRSTRSCKQQEGGEARI